MSMVWEKGRRRILLSHSTTIQLGNTLRNKLLLSPGAEGNHVPLPWAAALVDHAELQTQVCKKCTSGMKWYCALNPEGWWTHRQFRGEPWHKELSSPGRKIVSDTFLPSSCKSTRVQALWGSILYGYYAEQTNPNHLNRTDGLFSIGAFPSQQL